MHNLHSPHSLNSLHPTSGAVEAEEAYAYQPSRSTVRANMVATVDGAASGGDGLSGSLSGRADKRVFGVLRRLSDVVLVGAGTARAEGYRPAKLPIAVVSGRLDLDLTAPLYSAAEHRTIVITCASAPTDALGRVRAVADVLVCGDTRVDVAQAVAALRARGLRNVLCEGGPTLLRQLVVAGVLDELCLTISPYLAGGGVGRILAGDPLDAPLPVSLTRLLEDDGWLFARYSLRGLTPLSAPESG
jgi:riboflavin biosynthesis pyrimidine reductase